jgi:transcriptional regulator with XRE-family HTH domain
VSPLSGSVPDMPTTTTAANVRAEFARANQSHAILADLLGLSHSAVSRRMRGETPFRDVELEAIAKHLDVPVSRLFGEPVAS